MKEIEIEIRARRRDFALHRGISERKINQCVEFARAIDTLAALYGRDMLRCLLDSDRVVRLRHNETIKLAEAARLYPEKYRDLGNIIREGNSREIKGLLREI